MDVALTLRLTTMLIAAASAIATIEHLGLLRSLEVHGTWRWSIVRRDFATAPRALRFVLDAVATRPVLLCSAMLGASAVLMFGTSAVALGILLVGTIVMSLRFRGALGGGSDSMSVQVLTALLIASVVHQPAAQIAAVCFVAVQSVLSYVLAGVAKLRCGAWRRGTALPAFGRSHAHRWLPMLDNRVVAIAASWSVIAFECGFAFALATPIIALPWLATAIAFHLANARVFGLSRFTWIWLSTYPAVYFAAGLLGGE